MSEITKTDPNNHISSVRKIMLEQLHALRGAAPGEALENELKRSKAVSELSQTMINSAKVEVGYLMATDQKSAPFLEVPPDQLYLQNTKATSTATGFKSVTPGDANGIRSVTQHRLAG